MSIGISQLKAVIARNGVAKTNMFEVIITPPRLRFDQNITQERTTAIHANPASYATSVLRFKAEATEFPGRNIKTSDYTIANQPVEQIGYGFTYAQWQCTISCSENLSEKVFFEQWQEAVTNASEKGENLFTSNYYDNYVGQVEIRQYSQIGTIVYACKLKNAYPVMINATNVAWAEQNQEFKINVTMAYQSWKRTKWTQ
jgi:hypothetical protein